MPSTENPAPARILVVDDHKANRTKVSAAARVFGHETCDAADGEEALRTLALGSIDLVLLDLMMPVVDGFAVLERMRANPGLSRIPVIVISALEDEMASVVRAIELGAEDILPKDFEPALLKARLDAGLLKKRLRDAEVKHLGEANESAEKSKLTTNLYRMVLDTLAAPVFVVDAGRRLILANSAGQSMLEDRQFIQLQDGSIECRLVSGRASPFYDAIKAALSGSLPEGTRGMGIALVSPGGDSAAAYVLPVAGNDVRATASPDHCVIFVARRGEEQSMTVEILRTVFDLTMSEARIAMHVAKGESPQSIADRLELSIHTVRTHLKHVFGKTGTTDQPSLGALVNSLLPPI